MDKLNFLVKCSYRNLSRKPRITIFLIIGMAIGHVLTTWILTFRESSHRTMMENVLGMKYGREQITKKGYYNFLNGSVDQFRTIDIESLKKLTNTTTFRTQTTVLMASDSNAVPVALNGYVIKNELKYSKLYTVLSHDFKFINPYPLMIGKRLAELLSVKEGSEIALIGQAMDGSVANELFTVEKIIDLGGGEFEKNFAVTSLGSMQEFLNLSKNSAHLMINFGNEIPEVKIPDPFEKIIWKKLLPDIASSSSFMQNFTWFYAIFFSFITSLATMNTLSLSFLERSKEYRTSLIIGSPINWLRKCMGLEIFFISSLSLFMGNILILLIIGFFYVYPLDLSILTGGEPLHIGGMVMGQNIELRAEPWIFLTTNTLFIITQILGSIYPINIVLKNSQKSL